MFCWDETNLSVYNMMSYLIKLNFSNEYEGSMEGWKQVDMTGYIILRDEREEFSHKVTLVLSS